MSDDDRIDPETFHAYGGNSGPAKAPDACAEDKPSNVVKLHVPDKEPKLLLIVDQRPVGCQPHHFVVNGVERTVRCSRCEVLFDPIAALLDISKDWDQYKWNRDDLQKHIVRLKSERDALRREVSSLKTQKRKATVP
jgi:hypothetical protein